MRETIIIHSRLAWSAARAQAAIERRHGLQALSVEHLAARLAGGFLQPIDSDALKAAIVEAKTADLGELNGIKGFPGFSRAAGQTLSKAWVANLDLPGLAADAAPMARSRLDALGRLEAEALRRLPTSMRRPGDLVAAALSRLRYARTLFGRISVNGRSEMSPVWRPLLAALSEVMEVRWIAGPHHVPSWVRDLDIPVVEAPASEPEIQCESCASPRHEALEAMRWARSLRPPLNRCPAYLKSFDDVHFWHHVRSLDTSSSVNFWWAPRLDQCFVPAFLRQLRVCYAHDRLATIGSPIGDYPGGLAAAAERAVQQRKPEFAALLAGAAIGALPGRQAGAAPDERVGLSALRAWLMGAVEPVVERADCAMTDAAGMVADLTDFLAKWRVAKSSPPASG